MFAILLATYGAVFVAEIVGDKLLVHHWSVGHTI